MVTRYLPQQGIEMSTPGYPGHSGGPLFNNLGTVVGIQTATRHLALGTFPDQVSLNNPGGIAEWKGQAVAHLGQCISHELITIFLKDRGIHFSTDPS
jgi:S1-C subfamily serine protease